MVTIAFKNMSLFRGKAKCTNHTWPAMIAYGPNRLATAVSQFSLAIEEEHDDFPSA
ncbi:hypothetical protein COLO4_30952 [Corchorus olitorius]|uniref:Uncharacterized protein n=1 Tax=Corchorus olitorius TaxID=93759 RepID=A0A1R3H6B0_9ROSI|nr:hypothetical protein COLO4_30952 [Corchorus olitorius]